MIPEMTFDKEQGRKDTGRVRNEKESVPEPFEARRIKQEKEMRKRPESGHTKAAEPAPSAETSGA